jgi:hypothetical protein
VPIRDDDEHIADFQGLAELAEAFTELVATLCGPRRSALTPTQVVDLAARCMPRAQHAALVAEVDGELQSLATTSDLPGAIDRIRAETGEGPAFDLIEGNDVIVVDHLEDDPRWPTYGRRTVDETGILSIVAYRLYFSSRHRAALSFYSNWPYAFDQIAISTGAIFAAYASLAASQQLIFHESVGHRRSTEVHREIGVAVGILIGGSELTTQSAYQGLLKASRVMRRSLPETARFVIQHRRLPQP